VRVEAFDLIPRGALRLLANVPNALFGAGAAAAGCGKREIRLDALRRLR
jgi:hypothetical protein